VRRMDRTGCERKQKLRNFGFEKDCELNGKSRKAYGRFADLRKCYLCRLLIYFNNAGIQGHSRSPILVPIESSYTTSY